MVDFGNREQYEGFFPEKDKSSFLAGGKSEELKSAHGPFIEREAIEAKNTDEICARLKRLPSQNLLTAFIAKLNQLINKPYILY